MNAFWWFAAALVVGALLMLVPPLFSARHRKADGEGGTEQAAAALALLRGQLAELEAERDGGTIDAAEYTRRREELERRVLQEGDAARAEAVTGSARGWGIAVLLAVPLAALGLYLALGEPRGLDPAQVAGGDDHQITPEQVQEMVAQLAQRLENEPDNLEGWTMLARSYSFLGRYDEAVRAYRHLAERMPDDAQLYADWADALGGSRGGDLSGEPQQLIDKALALDASNVKALALAGTVAFQKQDYAGAVQHWEKILAQLPPEEELARAVRASVDEARAKAGMPPLAATPPSAPIAAPDAAPASPLRVAGEVRLDPALAGKVDANDTLFVFVRPAAGGRPLAALRLSAADLPARFDFTGAPLMGAAGDVPEQVVVGARISKSGNATPAAGDAEGVAASVARDARGVVVTIDRERR